MHGTQFGCSRVSTADGKIVLSESRAPGKYGISDTSRAGRAGHPLVHCCTGGSQHCVRVRRARAGTRQIPLPVRSTICLSYLGWTWLLDNTRLTIYNHTDTVMSSTSNSRRQPTYCTCPRAGPRAMSTAPNGASTSNLNAGAPTPVTPY